MPSGASQPLTGSRSAQEGSRQSALARLGALLSLSVVIGTLSFTGYVQVRPDLRFPGEVPGAEIKRLAEVSTQRACSDYLASSVPHDSHVALLTADSDWSFHLESALAANGLPLSTWATATWVLGDQRLLPTQVRAVTTATCLGKTFIAGQI